MKESENNEIDLLLRRMAKSDSVSEGPGTHLDADELNSFAEGVLPPATRSLYVTHLADCTRCRRLVAELAKASGVGVRNVSVEETSRRTLWSYLAGLFSPTVLRYGVPALSLVILAGVGWLWMQQRREASFIAQSNTGVTASAPNEVATKQVQNEEQVKGTDTSRRPANSEGTESKSAAVSHEQSNKAKEADGEASAADAKKADAKKKEEAKSSESYASASPTSEADRVYSPPPPAPAKAQPAEPSDSPALAREEAAKQRPQSKTGVADVAQQSEDESGARRDKNAAVAGRKAEARKAPRGLTVGGGLLKDDQSATRTVGGRHFRRENNVWVDTAYTSSTSLTQITRGSEQYRGLVGDEPGLRTIVEELDGEVIVVWKGKAYRIR